MPERYSNWIVLLVTTGLLANGQILRGKVVKEDGSTLEGPVSIERVCPGTQPLRETMTNRKGEFVWRAFTGLYGASPASRGGAPPVLTGMYTPVLCFLRASLKGYESNKIDLSDPGVTARPTLPDFILRPKQAADLEMVEDAKLPRAASKSWNLAIKATEEQKWPEAERWLLETVRAVPNFASAWSAIGVAYQKQGKMNDARDAFRHAIDADKTALLPYVSLMRIEAAERNWTEAARAAETVIQTDSQHRYLDAYLDAAVAHYQLHELDTAETTLDAGLEIDKKHTIPQFEYVLGLVQEAEGHKAEAIEHFGKYLELAPESPEAAATKSHVAQLMDAPADAAPGLLDATETLTLSTEPNTLLIGEAPVPGGIKALSSIAHVKPGTRSADFFLEYARAVARETSPFNEHRVPGYAAKVTAYMTSVEELTRLGETRGDVTRVSLSLANEASAQKTERILPLLGWRVVRRNGSARVELGDQPEDDSRQKIPRALGIDELAMQETLEGGREFRFEIPRETAPVVGGSAWGVLLEGFPSLPGGVAEAFVREPRIAKTYAGIASMTAETSIPAAQGLGLRRLMMYYADVLWLYSGAFAVKSGKTVTPGDAKAEKVWEALAGANPRDAVRFLQALIQTDQGRLAAFYYALSKADAAHQRFFLHDVSRARRYYNWYRDSDELQAGIGRPAHIWRPTFFQKLPLDASGNIRFPGGKDAWTSNLSSSLSIPDNELPLRLISAEALVEVAGLEESRKTPLDATSAKLLAQHFRDWRSLFPYFQLLTKLGPGDFKALAQFSNAVAGYPYARKNLVLGHWYSMMALVAMGRQAGSLDDQAAARAFRQLCDLSAGDDYFSHSRKVLRELLGSREDLDEAVEEFLRLSAPRRRAFDRVRELQRAPRLQSLAGEPEPAVALEALSGVVYGASMNPDVLLVREDPALLKKHQYVDRSGGRREPLFQQGALLASIEVPGSHLTGGFVNIEELAHGLSHGSVADIPIDSAAQEQGPQEQAAQKPAVDVESNAMFRTTARLVQVYATVTDDRGRYIDDLTRDQFTVLDNGQRVATVAFENRAAGISCALVLDTTESMRAALPALKNAALKLIGGLRSADAVAVYALGNGFAQLQSFTLDKAAAKRAVLESDASGLTALYDALVFVNRDLSARTGKKVMVVITDGDDNFSTLTRDTPVRQAEMAGVPIYTLPMGAAIKDPALLKELVALSQATGGLSYPIESIKEIESTFEKVLRDLPHGYLLAVQPPPVEDGAWRSIEVILNTPKSGTVRARQGYYPQ